MPLIQIHTLTVASKYFYKIVIINRKSLKSLSHTCPVLHQLDLNSGFIFSRPLTHHPGMSPHGPGSPHGSMGAPRSPDYSSTGSPHSFQPPMSPDGSTTSGPLTPGLNLPTDTPPPAYMPPDGENHGDNMDTGRSSNAPYNLPRVGNIGMGRL